jgi:hypothetical protein
MRGLWGRALLLLLRSSLDGAEDVSYLSVQGGELEVDHAAARMKDYVDRRTEGREVFANSLAHAAFDAVAIDRFAHDFADSETDARACGVRIAQWRAVGAYLGAEDEEVRHLFGELFAACLVNALIVGVFTKAKDEGFGSHMAALDSHGSRVAHHSILDCGETMCEYPVEAR